MRFGQYARIKLNKEFSCNELVSVILPVYNAEKTLGRAIKSILNQTYTNWELILIDDGSCDASSNIIKKLKDSRIKKIFFKINKGLVKSLNAGIQISKGKFIARMDADDVSLPERLFHQLHFLKKNPLYDLVGSQQIIFDEDSKKMLKLYPNTKKKYFARQYYFSYKIPHPTWMARSLWLKEHLYRENNTYSEDQELLIRGSNLSNYYLIKKPLILYSNSNILLSTKLKSNKNIFIKKFLNYKNNIDLYKHRIFFYIIFDFLFFTLKTLFYLGSHLLKKQIFFSFKRQKNISSPEAKKILNEI